MPSDEAMKAADEIGKYLQYHFGGFIASACEKELAQIIDDAMQKWIRVEDGLPTVEDATKQGEVLIRVRLPAAYHVPETFDSYAVCQWASVSKRRATHWKPLPNPPKEVEG